MLCQATGNEEATVEVGSQSPDGPYRVCAGAAGRLGTLSLRAGEWFRLAVMHGLFEFWLHQGRRIDRLRVAEVCGIYPSADALAFFLKVSARPATTSRADIRRLGSRVMKTGTAERAPRRRRGLSAGN
jgi:hypothetical protein